MTLTPYRVAALLPVEPEYSSRLLEGLIDYASEHPEIELVQIPYLRGGPSPLSKPPFAFSGALTYLSVRDTWIEELLAEDIPVVNTSGEWWNRGPATVAFDGGSSMTTAVEHLLEFDRPTAAYIGEGTSESISFKAQRKRFVERMTKEGLEAHAHEFGRVAEIEDRLTNLPEKAAHKLQKFLHDLSKPAVILCQDDYVARVVCDEAIAAGITIPDELAILGCGDYSVARASYPPISTIPQPGRLVGRRAFEFLHQILEGTEQLRNDSIPSPPVITRESTGGGALADERFQRIRKWIHEHACEGLTVNELVSSLPMSQFTFSKHFFRLYGRTPGEEIRHVKTERAKHYLRTTKLSVEQIADLCGFEQQGKFSKFFKRQCGVTPSQYRAGEDTPS